MAPTLTVHAPATQTPSEAIIAAANRIYSVTDSRGREITFRKLGASEQRRLLKAVSDETANKERLFGLYMLAACVTSIDGDEIRFPASELQLDALVDRLDTEGLNAVGRAVQDAFGIGDEAEVRDEAKN